jgi:hypothetical protein
VNQVIEWGDDFEEDDGEGVIHVYPSFGREHDFTDDCWCHPEWSTLKPGTLIHNAEN